MEEKRTSRKREIKYLSEELEAHKEAVSYITQDYKKLADKYKKLETEYHYINNRYNYESDLRIHYYQELCKAKSYMIFLAAYSILSTLGIIYLLTR
jgi:predicted  nucleic acid-binding Zn-ribbon protein